MNGYIKLYRKLTQWGWYQDSVVKDLFLHLLLTASFKDFEWQGKTMKAGQLITGRKKLAEDLNFTEQQIRTALKKLESTKEIVCESSNKYTIITVTNWESYQIYGETEQPTDFVNKLLTSVEKLKISTNSLTNTNGLKSALESAIFDIEDILATNNITNEQPTNNQQITNKQPHIKNVKNNKNIYPPIIPLKKGGRKRKGVSLECGSTTDLNLFEKMINEVD